MYVEAIWTRGKDIHSLLSTIDNMLYNNITILILILILINVVIVVLTNGSIFVLLTHVWAQADVMRYFRFGYPAEPASVPAKSNDDP